MPIHNIENSPMAMIDFISRADIAEHPEIQIANNSDFETQAWPGNGSISNPYRIESLHITSTTHCISIENTTVYFVISDCLLDGYSPNPDFGILLNNVSNGVIEFCEMTEKSLAASIRQTDNCNFSSNLISGCSSGFYIDENSGNCHFIDNDLSNVDWDGFWVSDSHDISILNNSIRGGRQFGVYLENSLVCSVSNNIISDFQWYGLKIYTSGTCRFENNTITMNLIPRSEYQFGAYAYDSFGLEFVNNTVYGLTDVSLQLDYVSNALVENNTFDNGVCITSANSGRLSHNFANNMVQGKQLLYTEGLADTVLDGNLYGQIILVDAVNVSVVGGIFQNVSAAITVSRSNNCSIRSISATGCNIYSILVQYCEKVKLKDISVTDANAKGILLHKSIFSEVYHCTITDIRSEMNINAGIVLSDDCEHSLVIENEIHRVEFTGIHVYASDNVTIQDNIITDTQKESLFLLANKNCTVINNDFQNGVSIWEIWDRAEWYHNFSGNFVGTKEIGYFRDIDDSIIDGTNYGQLFLVNCQNVAVQNLMTEEVIQGLAITDSSSISVQNVDMSSVWARQYFSYYDSYHVLSIKNSSFCEISDIRIVTANSGIKVLYTNNLSIHDVSISNVGYAIDVYNSQNLTVQSCDIRNNKIGFRCRSLHNGSLIQNSILYNEIGVALLGCNDNFIYENDIGWNSVYNAYDEVGENTWDNGIDTGNAWSDYSGTGTYSIIGSSGSIDRYPTLLENLPTTTTTPGPTIVTTSTIPPDGNGGLFDFDLFFIASAGIGVVAALIIAVLIKRRK